LPSEIRERLDRELIERGFGDYDAISDLINGLLEEAGYEIVLSRSGIHRYGQVVEQRIAAIKVATEQAKAITDAVGDDAGKMGSALISLVQEKAFDVLVRMTDIDPEEVNFEKLTFAIAKLNSAAVQQKKWQSEFEQRLREAADSVEKTIKSAGLAADTVQSIRKEILGISS
jgi:hypothetical protein